MATQLQIRRGTSAQVAAFTGAEGEIVVNTTNDSIHVNDGSTAGGFEMARVDGSNWAITNAISTTANISFGDNDKAIFGAGSDLQIYHDGSNSYIQDAATGSLILKSNNILLTSTGGENMMQIAQNDFVKLYHDNSVKLATTSTGIDVTGTVTATSGVFSGFVDFKTGGVVRGNIFSDSSTMIINTQGTNTTLNTNGGNVGIGTSSPSDVLHAVGPTINLERQSNGAGFGAGLKFSLGDSASTTANHNYASIFGVIEDNTNGAEDGYLSFQTSLSGSLGERLRIHSSGNTFLQTGGAALQWQNGYQTITGDAASNDLTYRTYQNHIWKNTTGASSTTDGTEIMRISGSNVGIGTSSPSAKLNLESAVGNNGADNTGMLLVESTFASNAGNANASVVAKNHYGNLQFMQWQNFGARIGSRVTANGGAGHVVFTSGNDSEVMRLVGFNVGIGTASPTEKLDINGGGLIVRGALTNGVGSGNGLRFEHTSDIGQIYSLEPNVAWRELRLNASQQTFYIAGGEAMRITSSGSILAGNTSAIGGRIESANLNFSNSGNDNWKKGAFVGTGNFGGALSLINSGGASDGFSFYLTGSPSVLNIQHGSNGGTMANGVQLSSTATAFAAFSDSRLKTVTSEISDAVASVNTLRAVKYTLNSDDANTPRVGLIAQEVQAVLPEAVDTINDEGHLALRYTEVIPLLVAAIKEQQATIESQATAITDLTTRLTTLENN